MLPLPTPASWSSEPESWDDADGKLVVNAPAHSDLFADPGGAAAVRNAPMLLGPAPDGDWMFSARIDVDFASTFDAGVLVLHAGDGEWAKLCFELAPQVHPMVVSVVTRDGTSDDANAFAVDTDEIWLRVSRLGPAVAFHASTDGEWWQLVRYFAFTPQAQVGLLAQSPTGDGVRVEFSELTFTSERLRDLRDGS